MKLHQLLILVVFSAIALEADSPMDGTWKLNPAMSKYENAPIPEGMTLAISESGGKQVLKFDIMVGNGHEIKFSISYPLRGGAVDAVGAPPDPMIDHAAVKIIDARQMVFIYYDKDGKITGMRRVKLGKDGKALIAEYKSKTPDGKKVLMYDYSEKQ